MPHYVYIIQSESSGLLYKGYTAYPELIVKEHNNGKSRFTAGKGPWNLVYLEKFQNKSDALKRELQLKKSNSNYLRWLISKPLNMINL
jgi:putative endonuclease